MHQSPSTLHDSWTLVGARSWIAQALLGALREQRAPVVAIDRGQPFPAQAGHLVWCSGVSFGAATRARDAFRAHVIDVERWLDAPGVQSFTYLSSTRVYDRARETHEAAPLAIPSDEVYALSKAAGERLVLDAAPNGRVVRLSNVFGNRFEAPYFLNDILRAAVTSGHIELTSALDSAKDYVELARVVALVQQIAASGRERIYNLAAGRNTAHAEIIAAIRACAPRVRVSVAPQARTVTFPAIDTRRTESEFGSAPAALLDRIPQLVADARAYFNGLATPADSVTPAHDGARVSDSRPARS